MNDDRDNELWEALVEAERTYCQRQADFFQNARDRPRILRTALTGKPWQQGTALSFLSALSQDGPELLPELVDLSLSHRWAQPARQAIDRIPRDRLWPTLTPIIHTHLEDADADDLRRLAELLAHLEAWPLLKTVIDHAHQHNDPEAQEIVEDFTGWYGTLWSGQPV